MGTWTSLQRKNVTKEKAPTLSFYVAFVHQLKLICLHLHGHIQQSISNYDRMAISHVFPEFLKRSFD
jgi:hypothetical protein